MLRWRVELRDGTALTLDRTYMDVASDDVLARADARCGAFPK